MTAESGLPRAQLAWASQTPLGRPELASWMPDPDSRATMLRAAQHFKLTHYEVQRLAIRMLANSCGIPLRSIAPVR